MEPTKETDSTQERIMTLRIWGNGRQDLFLRPTTFINEGFGVSANYDLWFLVGLGLSTVRAFSLHIILDSKQVDADHGSRELVDGPVLENGFRRTFRFTAERGSRVYDVYQHLCKNVFYPQWIVVEAPVPLLPAKSAA